MVAALTNLELSGPRRPSFGPIRNKMHAYRDALGASSVWILYPGAAGAEDYFPDPWAAGTGAAPQGVGALALVPGGPSDHLDALVAEMLGSALPAAVHGS